MRPASEQDGGTPILITFTIRLAVHVPVIIFMEI
jgi:hypothetical protein